MSKIEEDFEETTDEQGEGAKAVDKGRYPGDTLKDKKSGRKGIFVNEYGNNGKAIIVMPIGQKRSELWDANGVEIIKKVKRPAAPTATPQPSLEDFADDEEGLEDEIEDDDIEAEEDI